MQTATLDRRQESGVYPERKTDKITSSALGSVILRISPEGVIEFLLFWYTLRFPEHPGILPETTLRCPMETQLDYAPGIEPESPTMIQERGLEEEVFKKWRGQQRPWSFWPFKCIVRTWLSDCQRYGGRHLKFFRMLTLSQWVELRNETLIEYNTVPSGPMQGEKTEEILSPPQWFEAHQAMTIMSAPRASKPDHVEAIRSAIWKLVNENPDRPEIARRYQHLMAQYYPNGAPLIYENEADIRETIRYIKSFRN